MKRTQEDIEFLKLLQDNSPKPNENPWFTRKVMNRLPYKRSQATLWVSIVGYGICVMLGIACWCAYFLHLNTDFITKGDALVFVTMVGFTAYFVYLAIRAAVKRQDMI